jgi:hypothetical protein
MNLPPTEGGDPLKEREEALADAKRYLAEAQARQKRNEDEHRSDDEFQVGQKVMLSTENLAIHKSLSNKFKHRWTGPFTIKTRIGKVAYELDLPADMKRIHPVFHASKLKTYHEDTEHPDHKTAPSPGPIFGDDDQYEVEALVGKKVTNGKTRYRVRWKGYGPNSDLWVPQEDIADDLIEAYQEATAAKEHEEAARKKRTAARRQHKKRKS